LKRTHMPLGRVGWFGLISGAAWQEAGVLLTLRTECATRTW
jgi:hypothetical protein